MVDLILLYFIMAGFKVLRSDSQETLILIENASQSSMIWKGLLSLAGLFFIQWKKFGAFGIAPFEGASLILYVIIIYEILGFLAYVTMREKLLGLWNRSIDAFPFAPKIPMAIEFVFFCYLLLRKYFILFGMLAVR